MIPSAEKGRREVAALVVAALLSYPLGLALGSPWLLPLLNTAPAYVVLTRRLGRGDRAGAVLMNFMSFYVASLARAGVPAGAVVLLGWQPWALCRVAAFCVLGVVLAEPLLGRLRPLARAGSRRRFLLAAALGLVAD